MHNETSREPLPEGVEYWRGHLDPAAQDALLTEIRKGVAQAPLFTPRMPGTGKEMSVRMTNFGSLGWVTDKQNGYRYQALHPVTGKPWPEIPKALLDLWKGLLDNNAPPQACLVNYYTDGAKMGLHQDRDEETFGAPVLSLSLGNDCLFRMGGTKRGGKTRSLRLSSGDVLAFGGESRLMYHGVDRIYPSTSTLLKKGGRINLTLRRVTET